MHLASDRPTLARDRRGVALVEFALVLPLLAVLVFGILGYGQYFLLAHEVQQAANDAARAAIAGLNADERASLARASIAGSADAGSLATDRITTRIAERDTLLTVELHFDARDAVLMNANFLPVPDRVIARRAVVRLGGGA